MRRAVMVALVAGLLAGACGRGSSSSAPHPTIPAIRPAAQQCSDSVGEWVATVANESNTGDSSAAYIRAMQDLGKNTPEFGIFRKYLSGAVKISNDLPEAPSAIDLLTDIDSACHQLYP